jgi:AcrR family transcriptional regulator
VAKGNLSNLTLLDYAIFGTICQFWQILPETDQPPGLVYTICGMADKQSAGNPGGKLSSASKRNRLALIKSAQEVLAEIGPEATVEQFVAHAGVSSTTIYNHFYNKETLFKEALAEAWREWIDWAHGGIPTDENFETMIDVCRKLFRAAKTHPEFSRLISKSLSYPGFVIAAVQADGLPALKKVARLGGLTKSDFDKRTRLFSYCIAGILHGVHTTNELSPADADVSLGIALGIWNVSPEKAKSIVSRPLSTFL